MQMRRFAVPAALLATLGMATPAVAAAPASTASVSTASVSVAQSLAGAASPSGAKSSWSSSSTSRLDQAAADAKAARQRLAADAAVSAQVRAEASAAATIYVTEQAPTCSETGNDGSAAHPYCSVQDAVNAAVPGDTISIAADDPAGYGGAVITTSDLTLVATGAQGTDLSGVVSLDGVTGITLSGLSFEEQVEVSGSSDILIDSDQFTGVDKASAVSIDGTSSEVTVSRSTMNAQGSNGAAISVAAGARTIDIASNAFAPFNSGAVAANGVTGIDVVGNTIQRGCGGGVILTGATTGAYVENNVLEDADSDVDYAWIGGLESNCAAAGAAWSPDVTVDATAAAGTTSDYNDFYSWGSDDTAAYSWAGSLYPASAALAAAVGQGGHDTVDTVESASIDPNSFGWGDDIQAALQPGSAAIGSADPSAPGALASDLYGVTPYLDRGAVAVDSDDVTVSAAVTPWVFDGIDTALSLQVVPKGSGTFAIWKYQTNWGDGTTDDTGSEDVHTYAQAGTYSVTVTATDVHGRTASTVVRATVAGSDYTPYGPVRILDTRKGIGAALGAVAAHGTVKLAVAGSGPAADPIPAKVTAVVMNVTVVSPTRNGVLTVYPDESAQGEAQSAPGTSNLNFLTGQTVPNLVTVPVGPNGVVDLYNNAAGTTQVIADVVGYYLQQAGSQYIAVDPYRVLDTRNGTGTGVAASIPADRSVTIDVGSVGVQPSEPNASVTVTAVAVNLTAIAGSANGVITAYPTGEAVPTASNVNYPATKNVANMAIVPVGAGGQISFYNNSSGTVNLAADLDGYFTTTTSVTPDTGTAVHLTSSAYLPMSTPYRWLDTRTGDGALVGGYTYSYSFTTDEFVDGVVLNATVVAPTANGFLALYPDDGPPTRVTTPDVSNINFATGQNIPNMVIVSPGTYRDSNAEYYISAYLNGKGSADLVADVFGIFEYE